ncbi:DinB family protein [Fictibacillus fluitans]|uniref:DinB family protein n=1 Tax=Fictibacillus fluitans TaxID=3058422 RepID=A0ABT8HV71_9BACL|nr:DinB family protein [Fictibacillus sp. NE201]MDN4524649.1 DinB family protein [Fictibacillus sp. NE201]
MSKFELLLGEMRHAYDQRDWHEPLKPALEGLSVQQASWRPEGGHVNTIWETANHLLYYKRQLLHYLKGEKLSDPAQTNNETFLVHSPHDAEAWQQTVSRIEEVQQELLNIIGTKDDEEFDTLLPEGDPMGNYISSLIRHDSFHTGQIVQLRKLQGSWPSKT